MKDMSDEQLIALANGCHSEFTGTFMSGVKRYAKTAGDALIQLKSRQEHGKHGKWRKFLKAYFKGSPETATLYMRIARNWSLIVDHGFDKKGLSLDHLRWILAERPGEWKENPDKANPNAMGKGNGAAGTSEATAGGDDTSADASQDHTRNFTFKIKNGEAKRFNEQCDLLVKKYGVPTRDEAVREAVRREAMRAD